MGLSPVAFTKNVSVTKLFPIQGKQMSASSNNFTTQTCVKNFFDHIYNDKVC